MSYYIKADRIGGGREGEGRGEVEGRGRGEERPPQRTVNEKEGKKGEYTSMYPHGEKL